MQIKLKVILANGISYDWEYQGTTLSIGRDPNCDLAVDDSQRRHVSWIHARIEAVGEAAVVRDFKSKNGTYVNDKQVDGTVSLEVGDTIRLGRKGPKVIVMEFAPAAQAALAAAVAPCTAPAMTAPPSEKQPIGHSAPPPLLAESSRRAAWIGGGTVLAIVLLLMLWSFLPPAGEQVTKRGSGIVATRNGWEEDELARRRTDKEQQAVALEERNRKKRAEEQRKKAAEDENRKKAEEAERNKPPAPQPKPSVEEQFQGFVYLVELEKFNELIPFVTCCAIGEKTLLTSAREAAQLVRWRKSGTFHRIWVINQTGSLQREVEEIRAHRVFVKLAKENDTQRWIYFNVALLTVAEKLPAFAPLASAEDLKGLESGLPVICLGFSHDGKKLTKHNPPKLQFGKNNRIYTITTIPAPADLPFGDEPPRLLHFDGEIPHQTIDVRQENHRLSVPAYGSPVFNQQGRVVAVYGTTMEAQEQDLFVLHYATVVSPKLIRLWLEKEDAATWAVPDVLPTAPALRKQSTENDGMSVIDRADRESDPVYRLSFEVSDESAPIATQTMLMSVSRLRYAPSSPGCGGARGRPGGSCARSRRRPSGRQNGATRRRPTDRMC